MNAFRGWNNFDGRSDPRTWIYKIATRACQRMHRRRVGEPARIQSFEELLPSLEDEVIDVTGAGDPQSELLKREAREIVDEALRDIPGSFAIVLILREIADLSMAEIADILGVKEATVRTRLHRARLHLRKALAEGLPGRTAAHPNHPREVCLSMLHAKLEALDRKAPFDVPEDELCQRCRAFFNTLDLAQEACSSINRENIPEKVREMLHERFGENAAN